MNKLQADILITHEAPSCHPYGCEALDVLAMDMKVKRSFHGHHHDDRTESYRETIADRDFDAVAVPFCGIKRLPLNALAKLLPIGWQSIAGAFLMSRQSHCQTQISLQSFVQTGPNWLMSVQHSELAISPILLAFVRSMARQSVLGVDQIRR